MCCEGKDKGRGRELNKNGIRRNRVQNRIGMKKGNVRGQPCTSEFWVWVEISWVENCHIVIPVSQHRSHARSQQNSPLRLHVTVCVLSSNFQPDSLLARRFLWSKWPAQTWKEVCKTFMPPLFGITAFPAQINKVLRVLWGGSSRQDSKFHCLAFPEKGDIQG